MKMIKAVCTCKGNSETDTVLAIDQGRFDFIQQWGLSTWLGVAILALLTGGFWLAVILIWHVGEILNPTYRCNQCNAEVAPKQFRL